MFSKAVKLTVVMGLLAAGCSNPHYLHQASYELQGRAAPAPIANTARYEHYDDNPVKQVSQQPLATFSLDVDTGSYANVRRFLNDGIYPPEDAVRVEEMMNYFPAEAKPISDKSHNSQPFAVDYELAPAPWNRERTLLRVNIQAKDIKTAELPPANLVFLVDVSGSMDQPAKLPLIQSSLKLLVDELRDQDRVAIVTYSGEERVALPSTSGSDKSTIRHAIEGLNASGATSGEAGIRLAYQQAEKGFIKNGVNRILLATDGDFNVGISDTKQLEALIKQKRDTGITLSTLGVGSDNFNEAMMVKVADVGNGNYSYLDSLSEAKKVLNDEMHQTLITVAKDVKAQIEFNPQRVIEYRQIGYEKRQLRDEDFNNDAVDAGDIGAGKRVTVLFELTLAGQKPSVNPLRYGKQNPAQGKSDELAFINLRWKAPQGGDSKSMSEPVAAARLSTTFDSASQEMRFQSAVAAWGQKLRGSSYLAATSWEQIAQWASAARGEDTNGYRAEFIQLVKLSGKLEK